MALIKHNNQSLSNVTALPASVPTGKMTLLSTATASASASLSFNSTYINSDYLVYKFEFINIHSSAIAKFTFNLSVDLGSNYNVTKTTTLFTAYHYENDGGTELTYDNDNSDLAQSTAFQSLIYYNQNTDNDSATSGTLTLFNPSSTTYVKHFIATSNSMHTGGANRFQANSYVAGYGNTTSAVNAIRFQMSSGNIDDGIIKLYGVK